MFDGEKKPVSSDLHLLVSLPPAYLSLVALF